MYFIKMDVTKVLHEDTRKIGKMVKTTPELCFIATVPGLCILLVFGAFAVIESCKTAFTGFLETVIQMDTGFLHGPADHIVTDAAGAGEEVA